MSYITDPKGAQFSLFQTYNVVDAKTMLGQRFHTEDGREVVLVLNGAGALVAGNLIQHSPIVANHQVNAVTAYTAATNNLPASATITIGNTAMTTNQYQGGFAIVETGTGIGQTLRIASNPAAVGNATGVVITFEDAPVVALDATSYISLIIAPYSKVVINPTTPTASAAGVTLYAIPATTGTEFTAGYIPSYGFIQTQGIVACVSDSSAPTIGEAISPSTSTAGYVTAFATDTAVIGDAYQTGSSGLARFIRLAL